MTKLHTSQLVNHQCLPSHPKTRGHIAEALFIVAALLRGFTVAKVEGDNAPFDVFLAAGLANYRIQIKSAWKSSHGGYQFVSARSRTQNGRSTGGSSRSTGGRSTGLQAGEWQLQRTGASALANRRDDVREGHEFTRADQRSKTKRLQPLRPSKVSPYLPGEIDFIAAYLAPNPPAFTSSIAQYRNSSISQFPDYSIPQSGVWFIIPAAELAHIKSLHLRSSIKARSKYARFRNAWHLLESR